MPEFPLRRRSRTKRPMVKTIEAENYDLVDRYEIIKGHGAVEILWNRNTLENIYSVVEPSLTDEEKRLLASLPKEMQMVIPNLKNLGKDYNDIEIGSMLDQYVRAYQIKMSDETRSKLIYYLKRDFEGLGVIEVIVRDPYVEDVSCDGYSVPIFVYHRKYGSIKTNVVFRNPDALNSYVIKLAQICGKEISVSEPILDGATPQGHRVQAIYGEEISTRGSTFTFRLFREKPFTPIELIKFGTASSEMVTYFWYMIENLSSALIAGVPAVGKTSTLNAMLMLVPPPSKIFSIEETREINIPNENWIPATTRERENYSSAQKRGYMKIDMFELVRMAMRQRPTYIVVGEVRGREAYALFQSMSTGHTTYSTIHADSMDALINRLEAEPLNIPRVMMTYLNTVIFNKFIKIDGNLVRRITEVNEMMGYDPETGDVLFNNVFSYDPETDMHHYNGNSSILEKIRLATGKSRQEFNRDFRERKIIIENMAANGITDYFAISRIIQAYYFNHDEGRKISAGGGS